LKDTINDLSKREDLYRIISETVKDTITVWDMDLTLIYASSSLENLLGYNEDELKDIFNDSGTSGLERVIAPGSIDTVLGEMNKRTKECSALSESERNASVEVEMIRKDGSTVWTETKSSSLINDGGQHIGFLSITRDVSERKHTREMLLKSEERYRNILESIEEGYFENDLAGNLTFFNNALYRAMGYSKEELMGMSNREYTTPKTSRQAYETFRDIHVTGKPAKIADYEIIRKDGSMRIYDLSASLLSDSAGRPVGFRGVMRDITERKAKDQELERSYDKLQNMLEETIRTLAFTVEVRDPYTAGHQRRVAQLACAISRKMGFSSEEVRGVKMAALIHDVGKVQIPGEILSKPGPLSSTEMDLVRTHPAVGSSILKGIEFPWPISEIVLQHHERLNGSGYPLGISGKEMHIEAKIIAVADVVEAMVFHRPYRPALGMDKATEEISNNKGTLYDPKVVETCLSLLTEEEFTFD